MKTPSGLVRHLLTITVATALTFGIYAPHAVAHCDTLDGPVVQDARKALEAKDVTPVLKWVQQKDEKAVRAAFTKALGAKGQKNGAAAENRFLRLWSRSTGLTKGHRSPA